jgi:hypothetical protein
MLALWLLVPALWLVVPRLALLRLVALRTAVLRPLAR